MLILLFPHILPHLRRCAPEVLLEYPAKQLIIGETMSFQDHRTVERAGLPSFLRF